MDLRVATRRSRLQRRQIKASFDSKHVLQSGIVSVAIIAPDWTPVVDSVRPLKRVDYNCLVESGHFVDERLELLGGVLVKMSPQQPSHASAVQKLNAQLQKQLGDRFILRAQLPLALSDDSEPEPDIAVVALGNYDREHPSTALLVIEVSDSSLRKDRRKAAIYAAAGVAEYWIVNLSERTVEVCTIASGDRYAEARTFHEGDVVRPLALPEVEIAVSEILPTV
jgi:Uma2 family endonuclease